MESRQKSVDAFQNDTETKVFIANIKAGGVGINLTRASIVIFADMDWSPEIHSQAEDRAHRIGTTGTVNVYYYVVKDTIEEEIVKMLQEKKGIIQEVMEGKRKKTEIGSIIKDIIKTLNKKVANSYEQ